MKHNAVETKSHPIIDFFGDDDNWFLIRVFSMLIGFLSLAVVHAMWSGNYQLPVAVAIVEGGIFGVLAGFFGLVQPFISNPSDTKERGILSMCIFIIDVVLILHAIFVVWLTFDKQPVSTTTTDYNIVKTGPTRDDIQILFDSKHPKNDFFDLKEVTFVNKNPHVSKVTDITETKNALFGYHFKFKHVTYHAYVSADKE